MEELTNQHAPYMTPYVPLVAGSLARSLACVTCYPVELARTRMQVIAYWRVLIFSYSLSNLWYTGVVARQCAWSNILGICYFWYQNLAVILINRSFWFMNIIEISKLWLPHIITSVMMTATYHNLVLLMKFGLSTELWITYTHSCVWVLWR